MAKTTKGRVTIPRDIPGALKLAGKVYGKHQADGAASPLNELEDYKWDTIGPTITQAQAKHDEAEFHKGKMEQAYRDRDALMPNIVGATYSSKDLLKAKFTKTPKRLSDWYYEVDDTPKAKKSAAKESTPKKSTPKKKG